MAEDPGLATRPVGEQSADAEPHAEPVEQMRADPDMTGGS